MSNLEKKLVNWSDKVKNIMDSIDFRKGLLTTADQIGDMSQSLMPNLIPYNEYSSTVRPEIKKQIAEYIDTELSKYEQEKKRKSSEEADRLRAEGNGHYEKKDFVSALHAYTMSILFAPEGENKSAKKSSSLALAYGNRSATFFEIGQWANALADIEHALETGHQGVEKLLLRKADALASLRKYDKAKAVLSDSHLKQNSSLEATIAERFATIEKLFKRAKTSQLKEINVPSDDLPALSEIISTLSSSSEHQYEPSAEIPSLSRKLEVQFSEEKGRHLVAKEPIAPGDILAVELPYACTLIKSQELQYCHHCCRRLRTDQFEVLPDEQPNLGAKIDNARRCQGMPMFIKPAVPCPACTTLLYCSDSCRQTAWTTYHQYECSILPMLHDLGLGHLALRMLFVLNNDSSSGGGGSLFSQAKTVVQRADGKSPPLSLKQTSEPPYSAVYQLVHNSSLSSDSLHLQISYGATSGLLLQLATRVGFLDRANMAPEDVQLAGGLLQRHLMQLSVNAHAIDDYVQKAEVSDEASSDSKSLIFRDNSIASGLYPWISLLNHACQPNVVPTFDCGRLFLLRASAPIAVGEEVVNSYSVHFAKMDVARRQKQLKKWYNFECKCHRCQLELKNGLNGSFVPLKCARKNCSGLLTRKDGHSFHCTACGNTVSLEEMERRYDAFKAAIKLAQNCLASKEAFNKLGKEDKSRFAALEKAVEQAQAMLATGRRDSGKIAYSACRVQLELGAIADSLCRIYLRSGKPDDAFRMVERSADIVEDTFGPTSIELTNELGKVVEIMVEVISDDFYREQQEVVTKEQKDRISHWRMQYERLMTLLGYFSLSGVPPPLGDDSCYFASERRRMKIIKDNFDNAVKWIEEAKKDINVNQSSSRLQQMLLAED